jgi:hypothetical protein
MRTPTGRKCSASETGRDLVCRCRTRRGSSRSRSHTRPRRRPYRRSRRGPSDNDDPRANVGTATGPRRWAQAGLCRFVRQPPHATEIVVSPTRCDAPSITTQRSLRPTGRCTRLRRPVRTGAPIGPICSAGLTHQRRAWAVPICADLNCNLDVPVEGFDRCILPRPLRNWGRGFAPTGCRSTEIDTE